MKDSVEHDIWATGRSGRLTVQFLGGTRDVVIRLDSDRDPEFWAEVKLTLADIRKLARVLFEAQGQGRAETDVLLDKGPPPGYDVSDR